MIYRLRYCNKDGVEARVDIQKGLSTPIIEVEGTERPFVLSYNNDNGDKSGMFLSSSADIEIYETTDFNIDNLKTSNETELSVTHYINNVANWKGFIIPDFFSIEVRNNPVITMTASDRLGTLKNVILSDLPSMISLRELAILCLDKTGLELPLKTMADFNSGTGTNDFFNSKILTQRLSDTKGRSISCYDILSSILTASNSKLLQRGGEWVIINKVQHEAGSGKLFSSATSFVNWSDVIFNFSDINVGGRRTIIPVAASTGVYHEHGGGRLHPGNYDFSKGLTGWSAVGDFSASIDNRQIDGFQTQGGQAGYFPIYGAETENSYLVNYNQYEINVNPKYLESEEITIPYNGNGAIEVEVDVNATGPLTYPGSSFAPATLRISVVAVSGTETLTLDHSGKFIPIPSTNPPIFSKDFGKALPVNGVYKADSIGMKVKGTLEVGSLENYKLKVRIYGGTGGRTILVNMVSLSMKNTQEIPKGTIFKTERGSNFTKEHEIETTVFGDYITSGLNGYFYSYPIDDTSSLYDSSNELTSKWTAYNDTDELPLLQHITRQKSRLFSVAHDLLSAEIEVNNFDPLAIFVACDKRYTVVSAQFDFFKSSLSVELEEVAFQSATVRDFIYSYFGDGESGIKSIGGISAGAGGGGTGGGLTSEQIEILSFWKKDPDNPNTIYTEMNAYSKLELSAYGAGDGGGGGGNGGGIIETVYGYGNLGQTFSDSTLTDTFNAYAINSIHERVQTLEAGGGGGGDSAVEWGALTNGYRQLTVEGVTYALAQNTHKHLWADITDKPSTFAPSAHTHSWAYITDKPSTFAPSAHTHSAGDITSGIFAIGRIPTGTTSSTVALGNHTHAWADITNKPSTFTPSAHTHLWADITDKPSTFAPSAHTHAWADITSKPSTFAPSAHTHAAGDITSGTFAIARIPTGTTSSTVALGNHLHTGTYEPTFSKNTAFNKDFGTASGTVAQGNDSRITNGQTAYGWGNHASAGYALNSQSILAGNGLTGGGTLAADRTITLGTPSNITTATTNSVTANSHTHNLSLGGTSSQYLNGATALVTIPTVTAGNGLTGGGQLTSGITLTLATPGTLTASTTNGVTASSHTHAITTTSVGAANTIVQTDASGGTKLNNLKVGGDWKLEQVGTELQLKYNDVVAQRFLLDGSIVGLGEITAYGASTGGEGVALLRTGGTMTGDLVLDANLGIANKSLTLLGNSFKYNGSNILTEANTSNKITMGNGWTIEQTSASLTIRKNGVIKGTFTA